MESVGVGYPPPPYESDHKAINATGLSVAPQSNAVPGYTVQPAVAPAAAPAYSHSTAGVYGGYAYSPGSLQQQPAYNQLPAVSTHVNPSTVIINATPTAHVARVTFGDCPVHMTCPHCRATVVTSIYYTAGGLTWLIFGILFIFGFIFCSCIPFCMSSLKDVVHTCPSCRCFVGRYNRL